MVSYYIISLFHQKVRLLISSKATVRWPKRKKLFSQFISISSYSSVTCARTLLKVAQSCWVDVEFRNIITFLNGTCWAASCLRAT